MYIKGLFTGSFDPLTNGHFDLIARAASFCGELTVGVIKNPGKQCLLELEERRGLIEKALGGFENVKVDCFEGLLADYVNERGFDVIIRGLRCEADFAYEMQMERMNGRLFAGNTQTLFLLSSPEYEFLSSSMVREVFSLGGDISGLVPREIYEYMKNRRGK